MSITEPAIAADTVPFFSVPNHHVDPAPDLTNLPRGAYASYWQNDLHEQLLFVRLPGAETATLYGGDLGWEPHVIRERTDDEIDALATLALTGAGVRVTPTRLKMWREKLDRIAPENLVLNSLERQWINLCWETSKGQADYIREHRPDLMA